MKLVGKLVVVPFLSFFVATAVIHARELPPKFVEADTNKDGSLSKDEVDASVKKKADKRAGELMTKMDKNGDGFLTKDEIRTKQAKKTRLADADTDGDGKLTAEEVTALSEKRAFERSSNRFQKVDANGDGSVTIDELQQSKQHKGKKAKEETTADDEGDPLL